MDSDLDKELEDALVNVAESLARPGGTPSRIMWQCPECQEPNDVVDGVRYGCTHDFE